MRKNGVEKRKIKAMVSSELKNMLGLYGKIGFSYCMERKSLARAAFAYLQEKKTLVEERQKIKMQVIALAGEGRNAKQIMQELSSEGLRGHDVSNWLKKAKKGKEFTPNAVSDFPKFNDWLREHLVSENGLCFETIESIKEKECNEVMDVTTFEDYHNFFANGFLTGNCGLVKNLAILAEVTTETEEKNIEKILNDMGVKIK
jgi:intein/homing endonuclease